MTFSIIVVCLNGGEKLHRTIESILGQTEKDYEIIVKDGGSTDGSVEQLVTGGMLRIYREKDSGIYDAMNQAVKHAAGEYIFFLNCGDYFYQKDVLAKVKDMIEHDDSTGQTSDGSLQKIRENERRPRIFYGNIRERMTGALVQSNPRIDDFACYRNVPCHQACFYDRRLFGSRGFDIRYLVRADYEHFLWCFYKAKACMVYLPVTVASYEGGGFSETRENVRRSAREHRQIVCRYMPPGKVLRYRFYMIVTLAPVRTYLADDPVTAGMYQTIKRKIYEKYERISGKKR